MEVPENVKKFSNVILVLLSQPKYGDSHSYVNKYNKKINKQAKVTFWNCLIYSINHFENNLMLEYAAINSMSFFSKEDIVSLHNLS